MNARMKFVIGGVAVVAIALSLHAAPAHATVQYLSVSWNTSLSLNISYRFDGELRGTRIGPGTGWIDGVFDGIHSPGGREIPNIYCVDLFQQAPSPGEWNVREYTGADGLTGWTTPVGTGTDRYRDHGDLRRTAWLTNTFGGGSIGGLEKVALNVVLWKAAYGDRFEYVSGLGAGAQTDAYNNYLAAYNQGLESSAYRWFDSEYDDQGDTHQDMITPVVPEPGTVILLGSGLLAAALAVRRRLV